MLADALYLSLKDLRYLFRSWETWFFAFLMPIVFFYFIGTVTGGFSNNDTREWLGVNAADDAGFLSDQIVRRLEDQGYTVARVDAAGLDQYNFTRRLTIPAGFTASVLAGQQAKVDFQRVGDDGLYANYDQLRIQRAVYAVLADLVTTGIEGSEPTAEALEALAARPRKLTFEVSSAGERRDPPTGFDQSVPGTMVNFTLLIMFTTGGISLLQEREQGILRRLASTPMSRSAVVLGKWGSRFTLGVLQIAWAMVTGTLLFKVGWGPHLWAVVVILLAYAALAAAAGMLLGNFGKSEGMVTGLGVILSNVLAALGGCWWPVEITPLWAQRLTMTLPTGWAMDALHRLMSFGDSPVAVLPHIIAMTLAAIAAGWIIARGFRFQ